MNRVAVHLTVLYLCAACGDTDKPGMQRPDRGSEADATLQEDDAEAASLDAGGGREVSEEEVREAVASFLDAASQAWPKPIDAGALLDAPPLAPLIDAAIASELLGKAYAEVDYTLLEPPVLAKAFAGLAKAGAGTRLFVTHLYASDAGAEARYGAADLIDAGLVWQKPPAHPRTFSIGKSTSLERTLVSAPFKYVLEARVVAGAGSVFRLYLEAAQSIWSATFSADATRIVAGELRGVLTREEVEHRTLDLLACAAACGANRATYCRADRPLTLATAFDCNATAPDVDTNGDGVPDAYRLLFSFSAQQVAAPRE
jgi:hypothetical protein